MKKLIISAMTLCCAAIICASEIEIKNTLNKSKIGDKAPIGWRTNGNPANLGKGEIIQGREEKAFKIVTTKNATGFYRLSGIKAKAGDKVKISAEVKGKGKFITGFYTYVGDATYFNAVDAEKSVVLTDKVQEIEFEFVVKNGKNGQICETIRPFIKADKNTEVIIEDLEIEVDKADK